MLAVDNQFSQNTAFEVLLIPRRGVFTGAVRSSILAPQVLGIPRITISEAGCQSLRLGVLRCGARWKLWSGLRWCPHPDFHH